MSDASAGAAAIAPAAARDSRCVNCGAAAPRKYCPECGQETRVPLPAVRELMRDAAGRLVAIDGRLWRTLGLLLFRPGMLTTEYLRGRRRSYVRPARLFFVMSLLFFAVIRLAGSPLTVNDRGAAGGAGTESGESSLPGGAPRAAAAAARPLAVVRIDDEDKRWLDAASAYLPLDLRARIEHFKRLPAEDKADQIYSGVLRFAPYAMVALLPLFALLLKLSYLPGSRRNPQRPSRYAEHLVYAAHLHAFAFLLIMAFVLVPIGPARAAIALWIVVYVGCARRRVYGGTWAVGLLRSLGIALVYMLLLAAAMVGLVLVSVAIR